MSGYDLLGAGERGLESRSLRDVNRRISGAGSSNGIDTGGVVDKDGGGGALTARLGRARKGDDSRRDDGLGPVGDRWLDGLGVRNANLGGLVDGRRVAILAGLSRGESLGHVAGPDLGVADGPVDRGRVRDNRKLGNSRGAVLALPGKSEGPSLEAGHGTSRLHNRERDGDLRSLNDSRSAILERDGLSANAGDSLGGDNGLRSGRRGSGAARALDRGDEGSIISGAGRGVGEGTNDRAGDRRAAGADRS